MKIKFREVKLSPANKLRLQTVNDIVEEYQGQGLVLTLRQLYYQLVSRDVIPNKQSEYSKLSTLLKEGRMGGVVDWEAIEDRLRQPYTPNEWNTPAEAMQTIVDVYARTRMKGQPTYVEVWVEKDALSGVLRRVTSVYHVPILVNRGYSSASAMYDSYNRFRKAVKRNQNIVILYLGDYDPSGIDMIRDIRDRIAEFLKHLLINSYGNDEQEADQTMESLFKVIPIALTRQQIDLYKPPPNPAKITDPRAGKFIANHGHTSWEVDALRPEVLNDVLTSAIERHLDVDMYNDIVEQEEEDINTLKRIQSEL